MKGFLIRGFNANKDYPVNIYRSILYTEGEHLFLKTKDGTFQLNGNNSSEENVNLDKYYTKLEIDNILNNIQIDGYITMEDLSEYVTNDKLIEEIEKINQVDFNIEEYLKIEDLDNNVTSIVDQSIVQLIDGAPEAFDTLKEISDWIESDETATSNLLNLVNTKVNRLEVEDMLSNLNIDLSNYVEKELGKQLSTEDFTTDFKDKLENLEVINLSGYATEDYVNNQLENIDLSNYVESEPGKQLSTEDFTTDLKDKLENLEVINLSGYATEDYVNNQLENIDLSNYVESEPGKQLSTEDFTTDLKDKLENLEVINLSGYATEDYVNNQLENIDLSNYVESEPGKQLSTEDFTTDLKGKLESIGFDDYFNKGETIIEIENRINNLDIPEINLDDIYTSDQINALLSTKSDNNHTQVSATITDFVPTVEGIVLGMSGDLVVNINPNHDHQMDQVYGLENALNDKSDLIHQHSISDINELRDELNNKVENSDINNLNDSLMSEINQIKSTLNSLSDIGNFSGSVDTFSDLGNLVDMSNSDMVIILEDETRGNVSTIYIYNESLTSWSFAGEFKGGELRDFVANPLNLTTETTSILSKSKYEKQNALETPILNSSFKFISNNVEGALNELHNSLMSSSNNVITYKSRYHMPDNGRANILYVILEDETQNGLTSTYVWDVETTSYFMVSTTNTLRSTGDSNDDYLVINRLGVIASKSQPHFVTVSVPETPTHTVSPTEVLIFEEGDNVTQSLYAFSSNPYMEFEENDDMIFRQDGTKVSPSMNINFTELVNIDGGKLLETTNLNNIDVSIKYVTTYIQP